MEVIRHQTVGQNLDPVFVTIFFQPIEIHRSVVVGKKDLLSAVSPLRNVMRYPRKNRSAYSGHEESVVDNS